MRKILPFVVIGILILSGFGAVAINSDNDKLEYETIEDRRIGNRENDYSHTILGEYGTATWCGYCKYAHGALKNIYAGGWHPFYYVSLVCDVNENSYQRAVGELGLGGYPTVYFDGGYQTVVGAGSIPSAQSAYNSSIVACGNRGVSDIDISLDVTWFGPGNPSPENFATEAPVECNLSWTNAEMNIDVSVDNLESSTYNGYLHTYVTEIETSMGWNDQAGLPYTFPFLDYAFNEDISVSAGGTWQDDIDWDGYDYGTGYGEDFSGITQDNIMVIAAVFNDANDYVDEITGLLAGTNTDPKTFDVYFGDSNPPPKVSSTQSNLYYIPDDNLDFDTTYYWKIVVWDNQGASQTGPIWSFTSRGNDPPNSPSDPDPYTGETDVFINTAISWTGGDPDGDDVTYDVYFGTSNPPPKVVNNQTGTSYNPPGELNFDTIYYWKIVAWDVYEYTSVGSIWSFTTEENDPPNTPSNPDPEDGETDVDIYKLLLWTGGDPNPGDKVTYDIYFGTSNPPPLEAEDLMQAAYDPGTMELDTVYYWQIVSEDSEGLITSGPIWYFTTELEINEPPGAPTISGPNNGDVGTSYEYIFNAVDPDGDNVRYIIVWGDTNTDTTGYAASGTDVPFSHTWTNGGSFTITAKAQDTLGAIGPETTKTVTMPRSRAMNFLFFRFLQNHPYLFPLLRQLSGL